MPKFEIKILNNCLEIYILVASKILKNQAQQLRSKSGQWVNMSLNHQTLADS
jgi:hypothetical protein